MSILDIGSSNLYSATPDGIKGFVQKYGSPQIARLEEFAARLAAGSAYDPVRGGLNEAFAGELFEKAGMQYVSLDIAAGYKTTILDLNHAGVPPELEGTFALVLNFGTSEHVLNQYNCFKVIHEATKIGGYMYHQLPAFGYADHGYVTYTARCFLDLARYNEYKLVACWFEGPGGGNHVYDGLQNCSEEFPVLKKALKQTNATQQGLALREISIPDISINVVYRKVKQNPFRGALETSTSVGTLSDAVAAGYSDSKSWDHVSTTPATTARGDLLVRRLSRGLRRFPVMHGVARQAYHSFRRWKSMLGEMSIPQQAPAGGENARAVQLKKSLAKTKNVVALGSEVRPGIFVVTLPKSGSVFIHTAIHKITGLKPMLPSHGYFPVDMLNVDSMLEFQRGGFVAQSHCDASEFNLRVLDFYGINWVLHVRDPRAALLSWTHHVERPDIRHNPSGHLRSWPAHPDGYFDLPFSAKLDWQIEHWLPGVVHWLEHWCDVLDLPNYRGRILLTTYEQMHGRDHAFIGDLIKRFYGRQPVDIDVPARDITSHFRSGRRDEWREVFSSDQVQRATAAIGRRLLERFGWSD